jgi:SAM-dependent methyltransferase
MWGRIKGRMDLPLGAKVLDLGCGSGLAMDMFYDEGLVPLGVTVMTEEAKAINDRGIGSAAIMDMHEIGCFENYFDLVWARHVMEHSPCPMFVLDQIHKALKPNGYLYLEVPGSKECGSASGHEANASHYSVMGPRMWVSLLVRTGFTILESMDINFATQLGPDVYHSFLCQATVSA